MKRRDCLKSLAFGLTALACPFTAAAAPNRKPVDLSKTPARWTLNRPVLLADYGGNMIYKLGADGEIQWSHPAQRPQDVWMLPSGNILFSHVKGATEVTPDKKVAWSYTVPNSSEVHAAQPLPGGLVLVAESGPAQILEVDREGNVQKTVKLTIATKKTHGQMRCVRKTAAGTYMVGQYTDQVVREYDGSGKILNEWKHPHAFSGIRLPNGGTLCSCGDAHRVVEFGADGKVLWELTENELPGCPIRFAAGLQRLPNGNTLICNWGGHGHVGEQPQIVEVSPDKKIVGELYDFHRFSTIAGIYALGLEGDPTNFEIIR